VPLWKVALLSFTALITMVNPLAVVPSFIALTDSVSRATRARVAFVAGLSCVIVLAVFLLAGNYLFDFFGITVPAFQIMGGILFLTNALRTLVTDDRRAYNLGGEKRMEDHDVVKAEIDPTSIAIVPLAVPMLSGPGAITSVMVLVNLYPHIEQKMAVWWLLSPSAQSRGSFCWQRCRCRGWSAIAAAPSSPRSWPCSSAPSASSSSSMDSSLSSSRS